MTLIQKVAKDLNMPEDEVKKVIDFYYKRLKDRLTSLESNAFVLENFGKFYIKTWPLESREKRIRGFLEYAGTQETLTPYKESMVRDLKENLIKIENIKKVLAGIKQKREFVRLHKQTYKNEQTNKDMEG